MPENEHLRISTVHIATSARCYALCAVVLSLLGAAVVGVGAVVGGYEHIKMKESVGGSAAAQKSLMSDQAHLAAQLTQVRLVNTGLGSRLQAAEAALTALQTSSLASKRGSGDMLKGSKGKRRGGGKEEAAAPSPASGKDGGEGTAGGGGEADANAASKEEEDDDDEPAKGKGKGKGRKGKRRGKGRR